MLLWNPKKVIIIRGNNSCNEVTNAIGKENHFTIILYQFLFMSFFNTFV